VATFGFLAAISSLKLPSNISLAGADFTDPESPRGRRSSIKRSEGLKAGKYFTQKKLSACLGVLVRDKKDVNPDLG
jgi:hypothetical protein